MLVGIGIEREFWRRTNGTTIWTLTSTPRKKCISNGAACTKMYAAATKVRDMRDSAKESKVRMTMCFSEGRGAESLG